MSKLRYVPFAVLTAGSLLVGSSAFAQSMRTVDQEQYQQQQQIQHGIRDGQLTQGEAARLEQGEQNINRMQARAEADGHVSPWERQRIDQAVNRENREISRDTHNDRTAFGGRDGWGGRNGWDRGRDGWDHRDGDHRDADRRDFGRDQRGNGEHNGWDRNGGDRNGQHSSNGNPGQGGWQHGSGSTGTGSTGTGTTGTGT